LFFRKCSSIKHIPDVAKGFHASREFKELPKEISEINYSLAHARQTREENQKAVNKSGKACLTQIYSIREQFNVVFDQLEKQTLSKMDTRNKLIASQIQSDVDSIDGVTANLQKLFASIKDVRDENEALSYIGFTKCKQMIKKARKTLQNVD